MPSQDKTSPCPWQSAPTCQPGLGPRSRPWDEHCAQALVSAVALLLWRHLHNHAGDNSLDTAHGSSYESSLRKCCPQTKTDICGYIEWERDGERGGMEENRLHMYAFESQDHIKQATKHLLSCLTACQEDPRPTLQLTRCLPLSQHTHLRHYSPPYTPNRRRFPQICLLCHEPVSVATCYYLFCEEPLLSHLSRGGWEVQTSAVVSP